MDCFTIDITASTPTKKKEKNVMIALWILFGLILYNYGIAICYCVTWVMINLIAKAFASVDWLFEHTQTWHMDESKFVYYIIIYKCPRCLQNQIYFTNILCICSGFSSNYSQNIIKHLKLCY